MSKVDKEQIQQVLYSVPVELISEQEKTLAELLRRKNVEDDQLDLLSQKAQVRVFTTPENDIYSVYLPETKLLGPDFAQLLYQARPSHPRKTNFGKSAILADWVIPDRQDLEENKRLVQIHERYLKDIWTDFVDGDRKHYIRAISIPNEDELNRALASVVKWIITTQQLRDEEHRMVEKIQTSRFSLLNRELWGFRLGDLSFEELPAQLREDLIKKAQQTARDNKILVDPQRGGEVIYASVSGEPDWVVVNKGKGVVEVRMDDNWVSLDVSRGGAPYGEIERYMSPYEERKRIPWVVWSKDKKTGKRDYLNIDLPGKLIDGIDSLANKRLGMILATSLSEKHRDRLPSFLGLPEAKEKQTMAEPQIPLLVYMYEKMLLEGRFFSAVERSIDGGWRVPEINLNIDDILKGLNTFTKTSPLIPFALFIASFSAVIPAVYDNQLHDIQVRQAISREVGSLVPKEEYEQSFENVKSYFKSQRIEISDNDARNLLYTTVRPSMIADVQDRIHEQHGYYNALELPLSRATQNNVLSWGGALLAALGTLGTIDRIKRKTK